MDYMFLIIARLMLALDALIFVMVGTFLFADPTGLEYLNIDSASGLTAIRTWGGLFIGVGLVGLIASAFKKWATQGLLVLFIISTMIVLTRLYGIAIDGFEPRQLGELRDESLGPILTIVGLFFIWLSKRGNHE
jgi:hypothetical protein